MKSNKKGFTLIELLAVIVILAIIALIATPIVLNIIGKARQSAAADTVYGAMDALELVSVTSQMDVEAVNFPIKVQFDKDNSADHGKITYGAGYANEWSNKLTMKGDMPSSGTMEVTEDGTYTLTDLKVGSYTCTLVGKKVSCS